MSDIKTTEFDLETAISDSDELLANISGGTARIPFKNIKSILSAWSNITGKPFDALNNAYFVVTQNGDNVVLTLSDDVVETLDNAGAFASDIQTLKTASHSHDNKTVIDKFGTDSDGKLTWDSIIVGSDYTLPMATDNTLGGVKVDGTSITINSDGVISSAAQGLDFAALTTAMTTGTLSGINITADSENEWFNFEVTGIPTIAIDSEGYWTINGERGENPTKAQGVDGESGYSPTITASVVSNGVDLTIINKDGSQTVGIRNGENGSDGTDGDDGKSAYEIAVENGFIGTEEEWLVSLKGADGITTIQTTKVDKTCTFLSTGWSSTIPYTQTVTVEGITESLNPRIDLIVSDNVVTGKKEEIAFSYVTKVTTGDGILTAYCYETKPDVDLNIMIEVI